MFGDSITLAETGLITLIGVGTVFCVLILLVFVLSLFRFIPSGEKPASATPQVAQPVPQPVQAPSSNVAPLHKAIIMSAILESLGEDEQKYKVRISHIRQI